jgi:hypothetical protein
MICRLRWIFWVGLGLRSRSNDCYSPMPQFAKPLAEWTYEDIAGYVATLPEEATEIEFKTSEVLRHVASSTKAELCKDVSSMANSAGGAIFFGVRESKVRKHCAESLDDGVDPAEVDLLQLENIILSNIRPRLNGLKIDKIVSSTGRWYIAITVPGYDGRGPFQAPDKRYYRRRQFYNDMLEDGDIRSLMLQRVPAKIHVESRILKAPELGRTEVEVLISNLSSAPAEYSYVTYSIENSIKIRKTFGSPETGRAIMTSEGSQRHFTTYTFKNQIPASFPLFKEAGKFSLLRFLLENEGDISGIVHASSATPGSRQQFAWIIKRQDGVWSLIEAGAATTMSNL